MLRLLSWTGCDKVNSPEMRMFVSKQDSPGSGAVSMPSSHKRKKSTDPQSHSDRKRAKIDKANQVTTPSPRAPNLQAIIQPSNASEPPSFLPSPPDLRTEDSEPSRPTSVEKDTTATAAAAAAEVAEAAEAAEAAARQESVRNVIQTQLSLEILLKHKELRLIDQEIAKCQIALEQLRRCKEIPYPGTQQLSAAVSTGTGLALRSSFPTPLPQSPAPWGVGDGPYTRHYAKWLLPDHRFDGGEPEHVSTIPTGKSPMKSRSMRGSFNEILPSSSTSRSQRSGKLKALPPGYGQPKEKATGPMIVKRKSDGVMVKLVCPDCGRHDFGSAQGFINHCRIGHGRSFASHDAAADACGEPVEYDESGAMIGVEPLVTPSAGNVHPLIRSAKLLQPTPPRISTISPSTSATDIAPISTSKKVSPDFRGSTLTPNLSELIKERGLGLDLQELVLDAKKKVEIPESDSEDSEDDIDVPMQTTAQGRHPQVAGSKQPSKPTKSPMSSPLLSTSMLRSPTSMRGGYQQFDGANESFGQQRPRGMTLPMNGTHAAPLQPSDPSPTSESNQAPSLVDDDEEYEPHSPTSSSVSDEQDVGEVQFDVQGDDDDTPSVLRGPEFQPGCAQTARPPHVRRPSAIRRQGEDREEKHVSFVSPSPARDLPATRHGGDRKKRK